MPFSAPAVTVTYRTTVVASVTVVAAAQSLDVVDTRCWLFGMVADAEVAGLLEEPVDVAVMVAVVFADVAVLLLVDRGALLSYKAIALLPPHNCDGDPEHETEQSLSGKVTFELRALLQKQVSVLSTPK